jgi:nucleotide-binding universal stress UspA family protein
MAPRTPRIARVAIVLAKNFGAELIVCHVIPTPVYSAQAVFTDPGDTLRGYYGAARREGKRIVGEVVKLAEADGVKAFSTIREKVFSVVECIVKLADEMNIDLIVTGTHGLSGFKKLLVGSVSSGVINHSNSSVLLVR